MVNINIKLTSFDIPDRVSVESVPGKRQDGLVKSPTFDLKELESDVLAELCQDFVEGVFTKAWKIHPGMITTGSGPVNAVRTLMIQRLANCKERHPEFVNSGRWSKDRKFNDVPWSRVDFENLDDKNLLDFYEATIRLMNKQM